MSESKDSARKSSAPFVNWRDQASQQGVIRIKAQPLAKRESKNFSQPILKKDSGFRLGAYVRLSPSDEIREEGSLVSHPQRITDYVRTRCYQNPDWGTIVEWYTDPDYSGKDMRRPAFIQMCKDIKEGKINAVIATELSRLSRNAKDFLQFWDFLKQRNVKLFVLKENFDTSTPAGEMMLIQMSAFAQFERESIVARIKDGARARAERGLGNGGPRRLGHDPDPKHPCRVLINESERPYVEMIFQKFLELGTIAKLKRHLNDSGYRTKTYVSRSGLTRGGKRWTESTLHGMLTNLAYIGKREFHKRNRGRDQSQLKPEDRYRIVDAQWPALISEKVFSEVQQLLENNKGEARRYVHRYRLRQLVWCSHCGKPLCGKSSTGKGGKYFYYGHMRKECTEGNAHLKRCPTENVPAPNLEEAVIGRLIRLGQDRNLVATLAKASAGDAKDRRDQVQSMLRSEEERLKANQAKIDGLLSSVALAPSEDIRKLTYGKIEALHQETQAIQSHIQDLKAQGHSNIIDLEKVFALLKVFSRSFEKRPAHEQRDILRDVVKRVTITGPSTAKVEYYTSPREDELFPGASDLDFLDDSADFAHRRSGVRTGFSMVDQPEYGTNTPVLHDFIPICLSPKFANPQEIRTLYIEERLSATQIAHRLRVSKAFVLARLHELGIRDEGKAKRYTSPENYRCPVAPFGYAAIDGKLVTSKAELRTCHAIVGLIQRNGLSANAVAKELSRRGFKNRAGSTDWSHGSILAIYRRWKDKL